ncbi:MAG: tetrahydromethanopterin S-methyltransferase subunit A [Candidatus Nitrosothermus koennekii]|nr:MAG: tetrahydromethanopterin S-methyltransferase subunit A [Candidatus Nitrosothermus koennekii]
MRLKDIAGEVCKILLPIKYEVFYGKGREIAVCTLASIDLLLAISRSDLMDRIALAARLFSENKGIDKIIEYSHNNPELKYIILSGKDVKGHLAGDALLALKKYGVDDNNRIINAKGKEPILSIDKGIIDEFRYRVEIINLIGVTDITKIRNVINTL